VYCVRWQYLAWGRVSDPSRRSKAPQLTGTTHLQSYDSFSAVILRKRRPSHSEGLPTKSLPRACRGDLCTSTWTPARHYATGEEGAVEVESRWTERRREQLGMYPVIRRRDVS